MQKHNIKIRSSTEGREFDCHIITPSSNNSGGKVPAVVLASAVHGVNGDIRAIAEEFAARGYLAAAPDLFWRTVPGPLARDDGRLRTRSQPRLEVIRKGETDMVDTLSELKKYPQFNGKAIVMGFCYGGPYALIGPKRLGYHGGVSCHGTQLGDYVQELEGTTQPICIVWGDQDHAAPPPVQAVYRAVPARHKNVDVHIIPGVKHGYMMKDNPEAFDAPTRELTMGRALAILGGLH
jgi:carboxymethylenebutenolidase